MNRILFVGELPKSFDVRWHVHDQWELVYCTEGHGSFQLEGGTTVDYQTGDVVAIPPRVRHANTSTEGFSNIHLTMEDPSFPNKTAFRVADDADGSMKMAFLQAKTHYMSQVKKRELILRALGDLIVSYLIVFSRNMEFSKPVERIRSAILHNYSRSDFALDQVMGEMPYHYDYLRKLFKKEVGVSPLEYMTGLRMKRAEALLGAMWTNSYTISEIAQMCGFEDALYFSRVFKKYYGCSPSGFTKRKQMIHKEDPGRTEVDMEDRNGSSQ